MTRAIDEFLAKQQTQTPTAPVVTQPAPQATPETPETPEKKPQFGVADPSQFELTSPEEQTKRFGGPVGSKEYYESKAASLGKLGSPSNYGVGPGPGIGGFNVGSLLLAGPMGQSIKRQIDDETWDRMSRADQTKTIAKGSAETAAQMIISLPVEIAKVIPSTYYTAKQLVKNIYKKENSLFQAESEKELTDRKEMWREEIPSWFQTRQDALDAGYGEWSASLMAGSKAVGDVAILGSLATAVQSGLRPKKFTGTAKTVAKTEPIATKLKTEKILKPVATEYKTLSNFVAKKYGGNASNTFLKLTPAGENAVQISVVRNIKGVKSKIDNYTKGLFGSPRKVYAGKNGPEVKLFSQTVKVGERDPLRTVKIKVSDDIQAASAEVFMDLDTAVAGQRWGAESGQQMASKSTFPEWMPEGTRTRAVINSTQKKLLAGEKLSKAETKLSNAMLEEVSAKTGRPVQDIPVEGLMHEFETRIIREKFGKSFEAIPDKPFKGLENKPIKQAEFDNINTLAKIQGVEAETLPVLSKVITGKSAIGDLTHAEYVNLAQTLGGMSKVPEVMASAPTGWFGKRLTATGKHAAHLEETTGVPLYTDFWNPVDDAFRLSKNEQLKWGIRKNELWGEYNGIKYTKERGLVDQYIQGNTGVITENASLSQAVKKDLIKIAEGQRALNQEVGKFYKVSMDRFGELYSPHVQDVGGVYQVYLSDLKEFPTKGLPSPRHYRQGSIEPILSDSSAKFDIYVKQLAQERFVKPALEQSAKLYKTVDAPTQSWMKKQVGMRLGAATELERWMNNFGTRFNKAMGTNLPPDIAKKVFDDAMSTSYVSALGLPRADAPIRDMITTSMIRYGRMGNRYFSQSLKDSLLPKNVQWAREKGWLVEWGVPGGEELAMAKAGMGRARATYRQINEGAMAPYQGMDNSMRVQTALQQKNLFDEAINRYNAGKISWDQAEKEMLLGKFSKPTQNIVRSHIRAGNNEAAVDQMIKTAIDEVSFPYRLGAGAPATMGAGGRTLFHLGTWNIHFANTMGKWATAGQWDNFMRFIAAGTAAQRSMERAFGVDVSKFTTLSRIADPTLSPLLQLGTNMVQGLMAWKDKNRNLLNENKEAILQTLGALGGVPAMPIVSAGKGELAGGGVGVQRWINFKKSVANYEAYQQTGIPAEGLFPVFSRDGKSVVGYSDFADLLWKAMGFVPEESSQVSEFIKLSGQEKQRYQDQGREKAIDLIKESMFEENVTAKDRLLQEANEIIQEFQITGNLGSSIESDLYPRFFTIYKSLPPALKLRFQPLYEDLVKQQLNINQ